MASSWRWQTISDATGLPDLIRILNTRLGQLTAWVSWVLLKFDNAGALTVMDFGAVGNGDVDDADAFDAAFAFILATPQKLLIPPRIYRTSRQLSWWVTGSTPKGVEIVGVRGASIIKPLPGALAPGEAAVIVSTDQNTDGYANEITVRGVTLEGEDTAGAVYGWLIGANAVPGTTSASITLEDCKAMRFAGVGARGMWVKHAVGCQYRNLYLGRNATNLYIGGTDLNLPTVQLFDHCKFREAGYAGVGNGRGVQIENGYGIRFSGRSTFEANRAEGLYIVPSNPLAVVLYCVVDDGWFETNFAGSGAIASNYHIRLDGTGAGTVMVAIRNGNGNGLTRSIYAQKVVNFVLDNFLPRNVANQIIIDPVTPNQTVGEYNNWPRNNAVYATCVTNNSTQFRGREDLFVLNALIASGKITAGSFESQGIARFDNILQGKAGGSADSLLLRIGTAGGFGSMQASTGVNIAHWDDSLFSFDAMPSANGYKVAGTQVVGPRSTGWTAMTGTATKGGGFDTATVTLAQLAQVVKAMLDAEITQGSKGP